MKLSGLNTSFQKIKMNQSGRSMTEMIGVLILVGILSVGALSGYGWAVDKYRSNTLSREVLQRAADIKNQMDRRRREFSLAKFEDNSIVGYRIELADPATDDNVNYEGPEYVVGIQVKDVAKRVCQMTFDGNFDLFKIIDVEGDTYDPETDEDTSNACSKAKNTMTFYVNDEWQYGGNTPTEEETTSPSCPAINQCKDGKCYHGEICIEGCCVENTQAIYSSDITLSSVSDITLMSDGFITNVTSDVMTTDIVMSEPETTHVCPSDQKLYCTQDEAVAYQCTTITLTSGTTQKICIWGTKCIEWACTSAELMQDPTTNLLDADNTSPSRDREIPMTDGKEGKYPYCALEILERCALVSYCDEEPMDIPGATWQQKCPSCFPGYYGEDFYDPYTQVCLGSELVTIDTKTDGVDILKQFSFNSSDNPFSGNNSAITSQPKETEECVPEPPCPNGGVPMRNGGCCTGNAWYNCGGCKANPLYIDNCGNAYQMAHTCCDNKSPDAPNGCSSVGDPFNEEHPLEGNCYKNYPSKDGQCCDLACPNAEGVPVCCSESDVVDLGAGKGKICCKDGDDHPACVGMTTLPLETSTPELTPGETTSPYGSETTTPYGSETTSPDGTETTSPDGTETTSPDGTETTSPYGSETTSPYGSETTTPYGSETTSPYGSETTSPLGSETTTSETTTLDPRVNHKCYNYCKRR